MEAEEHPLPSELFATYSQTLAEDGEEVNESDKENVLHSTLYSLSKLRQGLFENTIRDDNDDDNDNDNEGNDNSDDDSGKKNDNKRNVKWLWQMLTMNSHDGDNADKESDVGGKTQAAALPSPPEKDDTKYEWWMGIKLIRILAEEISPFELHSMASQSIVFYTNDGSSTSSRPSSSSSMMTHSCLCLMVCAVSLLKCPSPLQKRWKRWQSIVCETIRLFQNYGIKEDIDDGDDDDDDGVISRSININVLIWIECLVPSCLYTLRQLPSDAYHVAFLSSLIGVTSSLAMDVCQPLEGVKKRRRHVPNNDQSKTVYELVQLLQTITYQYDHDDVWIWMYPWRMSPSSSAPAVNGGEQRDEVEFLQNVHNIDWWSRTAHRHERVAGMDTSWNEEGVSILVMSSFDERPMVYSANFIWKVWFPHVAIALKSSVGGSSYQVERSSLSLLEKLVTTIPEKSLSNVTSTSTTTTKPDAPFETFQLLSNRIMIQPPSSSSNDVGLSNPLDDSKKRRTEKIVSLSKLLLSRYVPTKQVKIIRKLVHDCPHPGLQSRFLDMLRTVIFEEEANEALWSYIGSFMKDMLSHHDVEKETLSNVSDLVNKVELYVGASTMVQLWCMVHGKLPRNIKGRPIGQFHMTLQNILQRWMDDSQSMPPDDYFRLFLLEGALERIIRILSAKNNDSDNADTDATMTEEGVVSSSSSSNKNNENQNLQTPVVGEIDIF